MARWAAAAIGGVAAGLAAALAMDLYQRAAAPLFGQDEGDGEPATVKAADDAKQAAGGGPVAPEHRTAAGGLVHYALGAALGLGYGVLVERWPRTAAGSGVAFGVTTALVLDDLAVPALGWGAWPWRTDAATHAYGLSSHVVFGAVLEQGRRAAAALA